MTHATAALPAFYGQPIDCPGGYRWAGYFDGSVSSAVQAAARVIAWDRDEADPCQAGTPGCAIDHSADEGDGCETW